MNTYVEQVGGTHYAADLQHWDVMGRYDVDYLSATATKYLMRWRKKGIPIEDLGKAKSYLKKRLAMFPGQPIPRLVPLAELQLMFDANATPGEDAAIIRVILASGAASDLQRAVDLIDGLLKDIETA